MAKGRQWQKERVEQRLLYDMVRTVNHMLLLLVKMAGFK